MNQNGQIIQATFAAFTDIGKARKANEDCHYVSPLANLFIVCDGMGGQVAGGLASKLAVQTIKDIFENADDDLIKRLLHEAEHPLPQLSQRLIAGIRVANRRLYKIAVKYPHLRGMGTTVVALCLDSSFATVVHVGDSRIFRISNGEILQLTHDHSWLNELIEDREINEEQIETFAEHNVITRALGTGPNIKVDCHCEKYLRGDTYVLCTDGVHGCLSPAAINAIFQRNMPLEKRAKYLLEKALRIDGSDNLTVAAIRVDQTCAETENHGFAVTTAEESRTILSNADSVIREKYTDPHQHVIKQSTGKRMNQRRLLVPGVVLLTGLLCFILGVMLQTARSKSGNAGRQPAATLPLNTEQIPEFSPASDAVPAGRALAQGSPTVASDAVLAVLLFNSRDDFEKAALPKRAAVLHQLDPYSDVNSFNFERPFSIFLIDGDNNVIDNSGMIKLPAVKGKSR